MRKLRLNLESLSVQTFAADVAVTQARRTVVSHQQTQPDTNDPAICSPESGFVNQCFTWHHLDVRCVASYGMEEVWGCTGVCA